MNSSVPLSGDQLDVFIVPHTHDDTGWLSTVDEYYINQVQWILSTLEPALEATSPSGPKRKFSYVEMVRTCSMLDRSRDLQLRT